MDTETAARSTIVASIVSTKGGVGKTTLAANLGGLVAELGYRTLLIDADPQPTLSTYFRIATPAAGGLLEVCRSGRINGGVVAETAWPNLDLIVSDDSEGELPTLLTQRYFDGRDRLARAIERLKDEGFYDFILIDTQGAEGIMQDLGVAAADMLISPLQPETLPVREYWRGTVAMLRRLAETRSRVAHLPLVTVLNRATRTVDARQVMDAVRELVDRQFADHGGRLRLASTVIPAAKAYTEAATHGLPAHRFEPARHGEMPSASRVMHNLVWELWPHLRGYRAGESDA